MEYDNKSNLLHPYLIGAISNTFLINKNDYMDRDYAEHAIDHGLNIGKDFAKLVGENNISQLETLIQGAISQGPNEIDIKPIKDSISRKFDLDKYPSILNLFYGINLSLTPIIGYNPQMATNRAFQVLLEKHPDLLKNQTS